MADFLSGSPIRSAWRTLPRTFPLLRIPGRVHLRGDQVLTHQLWTGRSTLSLRVLRLGMEIHVRMTLSLHSPKLIILTKVTTNHFNPSHLEGFLQRGRRFSPPPVTIPLNSGFLCFHFIFDTLSKR